MHLLKTVAKMFRDRWLSFLRFLYGRLDLTTSFVILGLLLQGAALMSDSWILLERFEHPYCRQAGIVKQFSRFSCNLSYIQPAELARAGPWHICYHFPHAPEGHTDPYCSDFADDLYTENWLIILQLLCLFSPALVLMGSFLLGVPALAGMQTGIRKGSVLWVGSRLLILGGLCGIASNVIFEWNMKPAFLIYFDPNHMVLAKWWAFHFYLDGSILNLTAGLLWKTGGKGRNWGRKV